LESFFDPDGGMSPAFARAFEGWMPWETNPIYALLHEPIYCQGAASKWSAHRVRGEAEFEAAFDAAGAAARGGGLRVLLRILAGGRAGGRGGARPRGVRAAECRAARCVSCGAAVE
jgi:hypothetical protein